MTVAELRKALEGYAPGATVFTEYGSLLSVESLDEGHTVALHSLYVDPHDTRETQP